MYDTRVRIKNAVYLYLNPVSDAERCFSKREVIESEIGIPPSSILISKEMKEMHSIFFSIYNNFIFKCKMIRGR